MGTAIRVATDRKRENNDVYHSELREKGVCGKELNNAVDRGEEPVATVARRWAVVGTEANKSVVFVIEFWIVLFLCFDTQ